MVTKAETITKLESENAELKAKLVDFDEALILMDSITGAVESKDDWAEDQTGGACRAFLSKIGYKAPV